MASLKERVTARVDRARERSALLDHLVRTLQHYGKVNANSLAGAITYFGFLSFFPILALAFFFVGQVSKVYDDARADLVAVIDTFLPGIVGNGPGEIPLETFEQNAATVGLIGLVGLLYSGLGWLSGMRNALEFVFELPEREQPNFVIGKLRDLVSLVVIGVVLLVSVALSSVISGFSQDVLDLIGLENTPFGGVVLLWLVAHGLGIAATTLLFLAMFKLLADPHVPRRALLSGAVLGGVGFEVLKAASVYLIAITKEQPAFQAFGIALILLVWINYFSRVVMLSAAYAYTSPQAIELRTHESMRAPGAAFRTLEHSEDPEHSEHAEQGEHRVAVSGPDVHVPHPDEPGERPRGLHRAEPGAGPRAHAGLIVGAALAALGVALLAWRRSTR